MAIIIGQRLGSYEVTALWQVVAQHLSFVLDEKQVAMLSGETR